MLFRDKGQDFYIILVGIQKFRKSREKISGELTTKPPGPIQTLNHAMKLLIYFFSPCRSN